MQRKHLVTTAIALLALGAIAIPTTADAHGVHVRKVRLQDRCDPATFNAPPPAGVGPGTCADHNGQLVTFGDFVAALATGGHPKWNNHPDELDLRSGDSISAAVRGGEFHTFTERAAFGPGCVQFLNDALGLGAAPANCGGPTGLLATTGTAPGAPPVVVSGLAPGTHLFQCMIHPWMRTTVMVEGEDEHDD